MNPIQQSTVNLLLQLQEENRPQVDKLRLLQEALDDVPALSFIADLRAALGDPEGKLMQDELLVRCRELAQSPRKLHEAEAACAEMRAFMEGFVKYDVPYPHLKLAKHILSKTPIGQGWQSPVEWEKLERDRNGLFLHLGGIQSAIAEELGEDFSTPITEDECRLAVRKLVQQLAEARKDSERLSRLTIKQDSETGEIWIGVKCKSGNGAMVNAGLTPIASKAWIEYANEVIADAQKGDAQ